MTTYDFYILRQILRPLIVTLLLALLVLLVERMLRLLDMVLGSNGPLNVVFEILAYLVPHYLALALPISLFLGVTIGFNRLSRDGELDALHSAGIGLGRLAWPAMIAAVALTILSAAVFGYLKPMARYAYQSVVFAVANTSFQAFLRAGVFTEIAGKTVLIEDIQPDGLRFGKIFIHDARPDGDESILVARDGSFGTVDADGNPILHLFDGMRLTIESPVATPTKITSPSLALLRFDQLRAGLGVDASRLFRPRGKDEREFTLIELWERRNLPPPGVETSDMLAELHGRLVRIAITLVLPFFAIPLSLGRRRSDRSYGIFVGMLILVVFHHLVDWAENVAEQGTVDAWIALWTPFALFALFTAILFHNAAANIPGSLSLTSFAPALRVLEAVIPRFFPRRTKSP